MSKNLQIKKSNALVEAGYRLTLGEHRLLLVCLAKIQGQSLDDQTLYEVDALSIADLAGVTRQTAYEELKDAAERLFNRQITVPYDQDGKIPVIRRFRWVQQIEYVDTLGLVRFQFTAPLIPYLSELKERYTVYPISDVIKMTSSHAIRLYELLVQWRSTGKREVEVKWLKETFAIADSYKSISDFKRWVIEPAIEQINLHSPIKVRWSQKKTGRSVTHFSFSFTPKKNQPPHGIKKTVGKEEVEKYARPGESWETATARLKAESQIK
ncbi:RepB family plasmid replication initiator protein [Pseudomonas helleri]|uniref:RepB family plasmid replication initiator protein n=1 Tax=Pseudomonas helleri TaxID=1608996 RepID=UPI003FD29746